MNKRSKTDQKAQSGYKVVDNSQTELHQFEEDGEDIQMEINDGGAARVEFGSEHDATDSEDSDCESETE